jgi:hypothetical protein
VPSSVARRTTAMRHRAEFSWWSPPRLSRWRVVCRCWPVSGSRRRSSRAQVPCFVDAAISQMEWGRDRDGRGTCRRVARLSGRCSMPAPGPEIGGRRGTTAAVALLRRPRLESGGRVPGGRGRASARGSDSTTVRYADPASTPGGWRSLPSAAAGHPASVTISGTLTWGRGIFLGSGREQHEAM